MKLVLAVVEDDDAVALMNALIDEGLGATKLASTGGFLLRGNTTLLIGVEDHQVEQVLDTCRRVCRRRKKLTPQASAEIPAAVTIPFEVEAGGAIVFVLEVSQFQRI
jgi:uncharacterized protein YaaQ